MAHLTVESIVDGLEDRLDSDDLQALRAHLASCAACMAELSSYGRLLDVMRAPAIEQAPDVVLQRAFDIFERSQPPGRSIHEMAASLDYDSWTAAPLTGIRAGDGDHHSRQMGMSVGDYELHLSADYTAHYIRGQVLLRSGKAFTNDFEIRLLDQGNIELVGTFANVLGEFVVHCDPKHVAWLLMHLPDGTNMRIQLPSMGVA